MNRLNEAIRLFLQFAVVVACLSSAGFSVAETLGVDNTTITSVVVNGGTDSANPGTTCVRIADTLSSLCTSGLVAILNNNKQLIASALLNKTTASKVWLYYSADSSASYHCPGQALTSCSVISIEGK